MVHKGPEFYDDPAIFETYWQRRARSESANAMLEAPVIAELVGHAEGLRVLDLGCGDAQYGRELLEQGCAEYVGLDGSENMVKEARKTLAGTSGTVVHGTIEDLQADTDRYDLVVSRLVLHYIADLRATFSEVYRCLKPGGRFVFSVEHPVVLSCNASLEQSARRGSWIVDDYFVTGQREVQWLGGSVVKYHRTVEDFFMLLQQAGFQVEMLRESKPDRQRFSSEEEYQRRARIPLFLFLVGRK